MKYDPDLLIIHCKTNFLQNDKSTPGIAIKVVDHAATAQNQHNGVIVSSFMAVATPSKKSKTPT